MEPIHADAKPSGDSPAQRIDLRQVGREILEKITEEEMIGILETLAGEAPEAQTLLDEIHDRLEEYDNFERFRKI